MRNTQKTSFKSAERWGNDPKVCLACVIAEQKTYLSELCQVRNQQLSGYDEAEEICNILCAMSKNVWDEGVLDWMRAKPLLSFHVVQPWLEARGHAIQLYGDTGLAAWNYANQCLKESFNFEFAMLTE